MPSSSPDHWRGGRSDASCCRALPFLLLSPRLIGVRRVCWSIFNSILLVRGHFWIKGNQIERRNHFHPPPGGGPLGTQLLLQQRGQGDHTVTMHQLKGLVPAIKLLTASASRGKMTQTNNCPQVGALDAPQRKQRILGRFSLTFARG